MRRKLFILIGILLSTVVVRASEVAYLTRTNVDLKNRLIYGELVYDAPDQCGRYELRFRTEVHRGGTIVSTRRVSPIGSAIVSNTDRYTLAGDSAITSLTASGYKIKANLPANVQPSDSVALAVEVYKKADECSSCGVGGTRLTFTEHDIAPDCPYSNLNDPQLLACNLASSGAGRRWELYYKDVRDCKIYRTVHQVGSTKFWMAQNLSWDGAGKSYPTATSSDTIGKLYTWYEAVTGQKDGTLQADSYVPVNQNIGPQGVCPSGWHVPTTKEWHDLGLAFGSGVTAQGDDWNSRVLSEMAAFGDDPNSFKTKAHLNNQNDRYGFSWKASPFDGVQPVGGGNVRYGALWTVPLTWSNDLSVSRIVASPRSGVWANNPITADNSQGQKSDYLPVRCVSGQGEEVLAGAPKVLQKLNVTSLTAYPVDIADRGSTLKLAVQSAVQPAGTMYSWKATPLDGGDAWDMGASTGATSLTTTTPAVNFDAQYEISVVMSAPGYISGTKSLTYAIRGCDPVVQGAMPNNLTACPGATLPALNPTAIGGVAPLNYQWQMRIGSGSWASIATNGTSQSYTPTAPSGVSQTAYYRRAVTSCGQTTYSDEWKVTTYDKITQPAVLALITLCTNSTATRSYGVATGGTSAYTYLWQSSTDNVAWSDGAGANNAQNYTFTTGATDNSYLYHRRIATSSTCPTIKDTSVVHPTRVYSSGPAFTIVTPANTNVSVCPDQTGVPVSNVTVTAPAGSTVTTVQWQKMTTIAKANSAWANEGTAATPNTATATATHTAVTALTGNNDVLYYRVRAVACGVEAFSANVLVATTQGMRTNPSLGAQKACPGASVTLAPAVATAGQGTITYKWQWSDNGDNTSFTDVTTPVAAGTWSTANVSITTQAPATEEVTKYYRRVARSSCSVAENYGTPISLTAISTVTQPALADVQACVGGDVILTLAAATGASGITYQWQQLNVGDNEWENIAAPNGTALNCTVPSPTAGSQNYYRRLATAPGCGSVASNSTTVTAMQSYVTVKNLQALYEAPAGITVSLAPVVASQGAVTYQWLSSPDGAVYTPVVGTVGTQPAMAVTLTGDGEYSPYYRLVYSAACNATPDTTAPTRVFASLGCPYKGLDMIPNSCARRTAGEQNWEAYIVDKRNSKEYRIVQMPGGDWWFAENLAFKKGEEQKDWQYSFDNDPSYFDKLGLQYPYFNQPCPAGWKAPEPTDWSKMLNCANGNCAATTFNLNFETDAFFTGGGYTLPIGQLVAKLRVTEMPWRANSIGSLTNPTIVGTDDWGFSMRSSGYGSSSTDGVNYGAFRASTANAWNVFLGYYSCVNCGIVRQYTSGTINDMKTCCGSAGAYVRCVFDSVQATATAPEKIEATYIALANDGTSGTTTLTASGGVEAMGGEYRWGTGAIGTNVIPNQNTSTLENVNPSVTTTYWVQRSNADGTWASGAATMEIVLQPCPYAESDRVQLELCRRRGAGEKNWEAYVRDSRDSKTYRIVRLPDGQWWMAQNLNYTSGLTYQEQAASPTIATDAAAITAVTGSYWCPQGVYVGDAATVVPGGAAACNLWGAFYSWPTAMSLNGNGTLSASSSSAPSGVQGVCPGGWHLPSHPEWATMLACVTLGNCSDGTYLSAYDQWLGDNIRYLKGKEVRNPVLPTLMTWINGPVATNGTDDWGFSLYPAGYRHENGNYYVMGIYGLFESATENPVNSLYRRAVALYYGRREPYMATSYLKVRSFSVRCARAAAATGLTSAPPEYLNASYTAIGTPTSVTLTAVGAQTVTGTQYEWGRGTVVGQNPIIRITENIFTLTPDNAADTAFWVRLVESDGITFSAGVTITVKIQPETCPYKGGDLITGTCKLRTGKARNWTAQIKDPRDGKTYPIVLLPDGRWWMAENLRYTKGLTDAVMGNLPSTATTMAAGAVFKGYYWCPSAANLVDTETKGLASQCEKYGALYPWLTAMSQDGKGNTEAITDAVPSTARGVCPLGWHLPSVPETQAMLDCVEGNCDRSYFAGGVGNWRGAYAGIHLKGVNTFFVSSRGTEGQDTYGLNLQPAGYRHYDGMMYRTQYYGGIWLSSAKNVDGAGRMWWDQAYSGIYHEYQWNRFRALSVRCVWNGQDATPTVTTAPDSLMANASAAPTGTVVKFSVIGGKMTPAAAYQWGYGVTPGSNVIAGQTGDTLDYAIAAAPANTVWVRRLDGATTTDALTLTIAIETCADQLPAGYITGTCKRRPDGAKNWTARMRDPRDGKEYGIVMLNKWYMADYLQYTDGLRENIEWRPAAMGVDYQFPTYLKYDGKPLGNTPPQDGWISDRNASTRGVCPAGWHVQSAAEANAFAMKVLECDSWLDFTTDAAWLCKTGPNDAATIHKYWGLNWLNPTGTWNSTNSLAFQNGVGATSANGIDWNFPSRVGNNNQWGSNSADRAYSFPNYGNHYVSCISDVGYSAPSAITSSVGATAVSGTANVVLTAVGPALNASESYRWSVGATAGATVLQTSSAATYTIASLTNTATYWLQVGNGSTWSSPVAITITVLSSGTGNYVLNYTGAVQTVSLSAGTYRVEAWGAKGGDGRQVNAALIRYHGGKGAYVAGTITLAGATTLYAYVGKQGGNTPREKLSFGAGGWNGGGDGGTDPDPSDPENGGGGGGASDLRLASGAWDDTTSLKSRIIVAGGGGGATSNDYQLINWGSDGGGLVGLSQPPYTYGGTQTSGFDFGKGGKGTQNLTGINYGGGGGHGGGYWGGITGSTDIVNGVGGAGGSSYISGHPGCNAVNQTNSKKPLNSPDHYSGNVFTNTVMQDGVNWGDGRIVITRQ
ncbi:MAG: hypothetical protein LBK47_06155 [Prevotellaceae bacterium]|nr:hypothetical protein [Prevotellaceae bacterium]